MVWKATGERDCANNFNIDFHLTVMLNATKIYFEPHRWWNGQCAPSSVVDRRFEPRTGQTKDYKICICCFAAKHATLRRKSKDWLVRNQDNVSECGDVSIHELLFWWASTLKIELSMLVYYKADPIIISMQITSNLYSPWYSWKCCYSDTGTFWP